MTKKIQKNLLVQVFNEKNRIIKLFEKIKLASSALLKLTQDTNDSSASGSQSGPQSQKEQLNKDSVYVILDQV
mgnify:CR=1 FL=1